MDEDQLNLILDRQRTLFQHDLNQMFDKKLDEKLDQVLDRKLVKFFSAFDRRIDKLENEGAKKMDVDRVYNAVDAVAKRLDIDEAERAAHASQLDRHNQWIGQLADATGTKLIPKHLG